MAFPLCCFAWFLPLCQKYSENILRCYFYYFEERDIFIENIP